MVREQWPERDGWTKSAVNPNTLLRCFPALRLKNGFVLRAYVYRDGSGNGNGVVWAMPANTCFPEPERCPRVEDAWLAPPKPPGALENYMAAVEGDGAPWSYLSASILARELREFGALWHGCSWSTHAILGSDPWGSHAGTYVRWV